MKLIFEALDSDRILVREGLVETILLTGIVINTARKLFKSKSELAKIKKNTSNKKEKMLIGLQQIDKMKIDYDIEPGKGKKFKKGYLSELIYRNVSNMNKVKEFASKSCQSVADYIPTIDKSHTKMINMCKKYEKSGVVLLRFGSDIVIYDSSKLYYVSFITDNVSETTWESTLASDWETVYRVCKSRKLI